MTKSKVFLEKIVHIVYNDSDDGKSFEQLLSEGIRNVNLQSIQKEITTNATLKKGAIAND